MDIATIWKLIGLGLEVDLEKKSYTVKLGPLTLKGISFKTVKALSSDSTVIEEVLSKHFIQRGVMAKLQVGWLMKAANSLSIVLQSERR